MQESVEHSTYVSNCDCSTRFGPVPTTEPVPPILAAYITANIIIPRTWNGDLMFEVLVTESSLVIELLIITNSSLVPI